MVIAKGTNFFLYPDISLQLLTFLAIGARIFPVHVFKQQHQVVFVFIILLMLGYLLSYVG